MNLGGSKVAPTAGIQNHGTKRLIQCAPPMANHSASKLKADAPSRDLTTHLRSSRINAPPATSTSRNSSVTLFLFFISDTSSSLLFNIHGCDATCDDAIVGVVVKGDMERDTGDMGDGDDAKDALGDVVIGDALGDAGDALEDLVEILLARRLCDRAAMALPTQAISFAARSSAWTKARIFLPIFADSFNT